MKEGQRSLERGESSPPTPRPGANAPRAIGTITVPSTQSPAAQQLHEPGTTVLTSQKRTSRHREERDFPELSASEQHSGQNLKPGHQALNLHFFRIDSATAGAMPRALWARTLLEGSQHTSPRRAAAPPRRVPP